MPGERGAAGLPGLRGDRVSIPNHLSTKTFHMMSLTSLTLSPPSTIASQNFEEIITTTLVTYLVLYFRFY